MHYGVRPMSGKGCLNLLAIRKFAFNEMRAGINGASVSLAEIIEYDHYVAFIQQELGANAPDIACAPNNKDFHWRGECSVIRGKSKATRQFDARCRAHR